MDTLDLLPAPIRSLSLSEEEVVLPYAAALEAITILSDAGWVVLGWEGWVVLGWEGWVQTAHGVGHNPAYQGTVSIERWPEERWPDFVRRAAGVCQATIMEDYRRWEDDPDAAHKALYFCLTASGPQ